MKNIKVHLHRAPSLSYEVRIGSDILDQAALVMGRKFPAGRYVVVTDARVEELYGRLLRERWERVGLKTDWIAIAPGEDAKNMGADAWSRRLARGRCFCTLGHRPRS